LAPANSSWAPRNVRILNEAKSSPLFLDGLDVYLYFRPNTTNRSTQSPIAGIKRVENSGIHIGLAHGSLAMGSASIQDFPIEPTEVDKSGLDYLALGHWHSRRVETCGNTIVVYSGIPQSISFSDPENGSVYWTKCCVESGCAPERIETSTIILKKFTSCIYHPRDVKKLFSLAPEPNTIIKLDLQYSDNCTERLEIDRIIEHAKSRYVLVQKENQERSQPYSPLPGPGEVNEELIGAYKAELERLRDADSPERVAIYDRARELGMKIIKGDI
jgi:DNA repair exonuclease SbcCD nuclease subunit